MSALVKIEVDGGHVWINPAHVVSVGSAHDGAGVPVKNVSYIRTVDNAVHVAVWGPDAVADAFNHPEET